MVDLIILIVWSQLLLIPIIGSMWLQINRERKKIVRALILNAEINGKRIKVNNKYI